MRNYRFLMLGLSAWISFCVAGSAVANSEQRSALELTAALQRTLTSHPRLKAFPWQIREADARLVQANIRPNPVLAAELENVAGTGELAGVKQAQLSLTISQLLEMGNKAESRFALASRQKQQTYASYQTLRSELLAETAQRYLQVVKWQQLLVWNQRRYAQTQQALEVVNQRAAAGAAASADVSRVKLRLAELALNKTEVETQHQQARYYLSEMWGAAPDFTRAEDTISELATLPQRSALESAVNQAPAAQLLHSQYQVQQAQLQLATASGVSDITVGGGLRFNAGSDDTAFIVSASMPLALANPNQGNIDAARARSELLNEKQAWLRELLHSQVARYYASLLASQHQISQIDSQLIPMAQQLIEDTRSSYQNGQLDALALLDAQQQLARIHKQRIELVLEQYQTLIYLHRVTGMPIDFSPNPN